MSAYVCFQDIYKNKLYLCSINSYEPIIMIDKLLNKF